jgi:hypothetical protein
MIRRIRKIILAEHVARMDGSDIYIYIYIYIAFW